MTAAEAHRPYGADRADRPVTRPLLRYYGGKWRVAAQIIAHFPEHAIYTESFGGGGSVLLQKPAALTEIYNDLDDGVVNVFRQMRDRGAELAKLLELTPFSRREYKNCYGPVDDDLEAARRFIFRAVAGIASSSAFRDNGFRTALCDSKFNNAVAWARMKEHWPVITERLRNLIIEHRPAAFVLQQYDAKHTLHYVDPPYVMSTRNRLRSEYTHEMDDAAHEDLAKVLHALTGMVILSGYDSALYSRLYGHWRQKRIKARDGANGARVEVLWFSPNCPTVETDLFHGTEGGHS